MGLFVFGLALIFGAVALWPTDVLGTPFAQLTLGMLLQFAGSILLGVGGLSCIFAGWGEMDSTPRPTIRMPPPDLAQREAVSESLKWSNLDKGLKQKTLCFGLVIALLVVAALIASRLGM